MGLAPAFLTFNPGTLGRASVAFSTHDLTSVAAHPHEGTYSTIAAQMNSFVTSPPILTQRRPLNRNPRAITSHRELLYSSRLF